MNTDYTDKKQGREGAAFYNANIEEGYSEMAEDKQRECEAQDWCEALIANATWENE